MTSEEKFKLKYGEFLTLKDIYANQEIHDKFPHFYVPEQQACGFIKNQDLMTTDNNEYILVRYIFVNDVGVISGSPEMSFTQLSDTGILIRATIPLKAKIKENIEISYIVDINHIDYDVQSQIYTAPDEHGSQSINLEENIIFKNIDFSSYENGFNCCKNTLENLLEDRDLLYELITT